MPLRHAADVRGDVTNRYTSNTSNHYNDSNDRTVITAMLVIIVTIVVLVVIVVITVMIGDVRPRRGGALPAGGRSSEAYKRGLIITIALLLLLYGYYCHYNDY